MPPERSEHAGARHTAWEWKTNVTGGHPVHYAACWQGFYEFYENFMNFYEFVEF